MKEIPQIILSIAVNAVFLLRETLISCGRSGGPGFLGNIGTGNIGQGNIGPFGEHRYRFWGTSVLFWGETSDVLGNIGTVFWGEHRYRGTSVRGTSDVLGNIGTGEHRYR